MRDPWVAWLLVAMIAAGCSGAELEAAEARRVKQADDASKAQKASADMEYSRLRVQVDIAKNLGAAWCGSHGDREKCDDATTKMDELVASEELAYCVQVGRLPKLWGECQRLLFQLGSLGREAPRRAELLSSELRLRCVETHALDQDEGL